MTGVDTPTPLRDALARATETLAEAGVASPEHDARALAVHVLGLEPRRRIGYTGAVLKQVAVMIAGAGGVGYEFEPAVVAARHR